LPGLTPAPNARPCGRRSKPSCRRWPPHERSGGG
jgi:hypothetical protein